ncbi:PEP-CTERM protein-sorting domain [Methylophilaceae bacterium]|jgi:hypothetical protein
MLKKLLVVATLLAAGNAHAALTSAGDIAFTAFNADEDGLSFVSFVDISANSTVYFADNEWNGSAIGSGGAFNTGEIYMQWVSGPSLISAGSVIRFSAFDKVTASASQGQLSRATVTGSSNPGISNSNETIYAYLGGSAAAPTTFLAAITNGTFTADGSLAGTGLIEGVSAIRLNAKPGASTEPDFAEYTGARSGLVSFSDYKSLVSNVNNWNVDTVNNSTSAALVPNTTAFTIAAVPEPETYAMFLAGLSFLGFASRRKN